MNQIANNAAATSATANSGQPPRSTPPPLFKFYYALGVHKMYQDKLQNCSCNQFQ